MLLQQEASEDERGGEGKDCRGAKGEMVED
jgi:hypothetical protein